MWVLKTDHYKSRCRAQSFILKILSSEPPQSESKGEGENNGGWWLKEGSYVIKEWRILESHEDHREYRSYRTVQYSTVQYSLLSYNKFEPCLWTFNVCWVLTQVPDTWYRWTHLSIQSGSYNFHFIDGKTESGCSDSLWREHQ